MANIGHSAEYIANLLADVIENGSSDDGAADELAFEINREGRRPQTFAQAEILTNDAGIVIEAANGQRIFITVQVQ